MIYVCHEYQVMVQMHGLFFQDLWCVEPYFKPDIAATLLLHVQQSYISHKPQQPLSNKHRAWLHTIVINIVIRIKIMMPNPNQVPSVSSIAQNQDLRGNALYTLKINSEKLSLDQGSTKAEESYQNNNPDALCQLRSSSIFQFIPYIRTFGTLVFLAPSKSI